MARLEVSAVLSSRVWILPDVLTRLDKYISDVQLEGRQLEWSASCLSFLNYGLRHASVMSSSSYKDLLTVYFYMDDYRQFYINNYLNGENLSNYLACVLPSWSLDWYSCIRCMALYHFYDLCLELMHNCGHYRRLSYTIMLLLWT